MSGKKQKTIVGDINPQALSFTVGQDPCLDLQLMEAECLASAAHVTMLSRVPVKPRIVSESERASVVKELGRILRLARAGKVKITEKDQDVHLAMERILTRRLGDLGRKVHTARSRNDQVAADLRLYAKKQLLDLMDETVVLADRLLRFAREHEFVPMVGRTHMQPAMPSSVGLWASSYAASLLDDLDVVGKAYDLNDRCPLGAAAGYGVPIAINRNMVSRLLGFREPIHNVAHASNARGKCESFILSALAQIMLTLSRLAEDMIIFSMPEFGYFVLPAEFCTGSSIMPQKKNPDVLELVRARAARVKACEDAVFGVVRGLPGGYNRDLQETKGPFMEGLATTRSCVRVMALAIGKTRIDMKALLKGFTPEVFATDRAVELAVGGMPFRKAYNQVKAHLADLKSIDPAKAVRAKRHPGAPGNLNLGMYAKQTGRVSGQIAAYRRNFSRAISSLMKMHYHA